MPEANIQDYTLYAQTPREKSIAGIMDFIAQSSHMKEADSKSNAAGPADMTTRYWKLKKRPKPKYIQIEEDADHGIEDEYGMTEAELVEKRLEIEERHRARLPLEQRFHTQIGQLELKMRNLRKR